ncbi:GntR family transcriptional regulator [Gracilibacillus halotolerans]|uniref:FadR/GntR family transcriptional regulator n=1 Tax=Gracilibacillus halotolerans TaxID=74386 RepID=UPI00161AF470|nr:GntR family transcriptional regulator [Gracilibacillus halotolerans]
MVQQVKVYQEVLDEIHRLIKEEGIMPGDKLPSERTLATQLNASRSSVREALRAIELLGMIVTRRGEGTYLRDYKSFQVMQLLATFVLQDTQTVENLTEAIELLENFAIEKAKVKIVPSELDELKRIINSNQSDREKHHLFFERIFNYADNQLIFHIWRLMQDFEEGLKTDVKYNYPYERVIMQLE